MGKRQWPYEWMHVTGLGEVLTRGRCPSSGLPILTWGWAPTSLFMTRRQLKAHGLCPGGQAPVVELHFQHRKPGTRSLEHCYLYLVENATPSIPASPAKLDSLALANLARRTCRRCGHHEDNVYLPKLSRMCLQCEKATDFYANHAREHGYYWPAGAAA